MGDAPRFCRNCSSAVDDAYCSHCGQREDRADMRFLDFAGELTGDLLDFDSRLWRTLIFLLFRPGLLTAEFIAGRRARYLPPLRLYLVISFIMFLVMSLSATDMVAIQGGDQGEVADDVVVGIELSDAEERGEVSSDLDIADEDSPHWLQDLERRLEANVEKLNADPGEFVETLVSHLPQMMFVLLPVFAVLMSVIYCFSAFHYLQHLVFSLHYHAFVYLLYLFSEVLALVDVDLEEVVFLGLLIYLPLALRRCYGSSWLGALGKSLFVYVSYSAALLLGFVALAVLSLAIL